MTATPGRTDAALSWGCIASALSVAATLVLVACGPGVATPIPEPPTLRLGRISPSELETVTATPDGGRNIHGLSGAAPAGSELRVTNLDRGDPGVVSNVRADGGFDLNIVVNQGDELRFDWSRGSERGAPQDALFFSDPSSYHFEASPRFSCLSFTPNLALDFSDATQQSLRVQNACSFDISIASPRTRLGSTDFTLQSLLPLDIPAGGAAELQLLFARTLPSAREDTLFVDVTGNAQVIRYPVTLSAPAQP